MKKSKNTNLLNNSQKSKSPALLLVFLGWLVYSMSYLGKLNYSANITQVIDFYGVTKSQAGAVPTFFFFAYGIGQVVNGLLCRKYNMKWTIFCSLIISAAINFTIAVTSNFSVIKWLWLVNGFVLSILWPTIIRLLSETLPQKALGTSSLIMGTTGAVGTLIIYALSSIYAAFDKFKYSFYTASFAVIAASVLWLILYNKAVMSAKMEKAEEENVNDSKSDVLLQEGHEKGDRKNIFVTIYILCFYVVGVSLIKDGLTTWVPAILKEEFYISDSLSILLTLFLPIVAIFGNAFALSVHRKIPDYVKHCAVIFAVMAVFISAVIGSLKFELIACMLVGLVVVNLLASSLSSLITSIFPLFMRGKVNSGLFAGVLNGFCYAGSAISSYGLGTIADKFGWISVFWILIGFCVVTLIVCGGYFLFRHTPGKQKS